MVKRITWINIAKISFIQILEFYVDRNKSKTYSRKLNSQIKRTVKLLLKFPLIGKKTDFAEIRVLVYDKFKIFYQLTEEEIIIHFVFDTRQDEN